MDKKHVRLQIVDAYGETFEEELVLEDGDTLIAQVPVRMNLRDRAHLAKVIGHGLEDEAKAIIIPDDVQLKILKKR